MLARLTAPFVAKVFAGLAAFLFVVVGIQSLRAEHYKRNAASWKLAYQNQKAAYEAAQEAATAKAIAARLAEENRHRVEVERNNDELESLRRSYRAATDRYASRMRAQIAGSASGGTLAPGEDRDPESPQRAGEVAILVGRDDLDILVENTVRLKAAYDWAKTLNQEPIPSPAFGK